MRRREPPQRYLPDEEATRPQQQRQIATADIRLAVRSLAERIGAAEFSKMALRELRKALAAHLRVPLHALQATATCRAFGPGLQEVGGKDKGPLEDNTPPAPHVQGR